MAKKLQLTGKIGGLDVSGATVGQIIKVAAVDDDGKPTVWEPTNLPEQAQADWNQSDSAAVDYVKNRTHYDVSFNLDTTKTLGSIEFNSSFGFRKVSDSIINIPESVNAEYQGEIYSVHENIFPEYNAHEYIITINDMKTTVAMVITQENTSIPVRYHGTVYIVNNPSIGTYVLMNPGGIDCPVVVTLFSDDVHPLDEKFIPDSVKHMYINITQNEDGSFSADKTFAEIQEHINNGGTVSAMFAHELNMALILVDPGTFIFHLFLEGSHGFYILKQMMVLILTIYICMMNSLTAIKE